MKKMNVNDVIGKNLAITGFNNKGEVTFCEQLEIGEVEKYNFYYKVIKKGGYLKEGYIIDKHLFKTIMEKQRYLNVTLFNGEFHSAAYYELK